MGTKLKAPAHRFRGMPDFPKAFEEVTYNEIVKVVDGICEVTHPDSVKTLLVMGYTPVVEEVSHSFSSRNPVTNDGQKGFKRTPVSQEAKPQLEENKVNRRVTRKRGRSNFINRVKGRIGL